MGGVGVLGRTVPRDAPVLTPKSLYPPPFRPQTRIEGTDAGCAAVEEAPRARVWAMGLEVGRLGGEISGLRVRVWCLGDRALRMRVYGRCTPSSSVESVNDWQLTGKTVSWYTSILGDR